MNNLYEGTVGASILLRAVQRYPENLAIVHDDRCFSYRQYSEQVSRTIQALEERGLQRGDAIAVLSKNRPEPLFVLAAAQVMGLCYVPLHPLASKDDHSYAIEHCKAKAFVFDGTYLDHVKDLPSVGGINKISISFDKNDYYPSLEELARKYDPQSIAVKAQPDDTLQIIFTGGTTGTPKGVMWSQRMFINQTKQFLAEFEWPREVRFLAAAPVSHALLGMIPVVHSKGGALVLNNGFNALTFMQTVERCKISATFLVPTMIYALLDHPDVNKFDLSSLEMIIYGAAPMNAARLSQGLARFGRIFCQLYGQTESSALTYLSQVDHDLAKPHLLASCGRPLLGLDVRLKSGDGGDVATGAIGELCVRGPNVMNGYVDMPDETANVLRGDWLHTGDLARSDEDGYIYLVGRAKDMIVSGGFNVYPREVEDALEQHEAVLVSAVIGVPHEKWGEAVYAFIVPRPGMTANVNELIAHVREKKGPVHAPKEIIVLDDLPRTSLGKIDKNALREPYWRGLNRQIA